MAPALDDHAARGGGARRRSKRWAWPTAPRRPAGELTNKELRLMELARALAGRPRLLLLDETLAGLGREECDELLAVLRQLRARGMTIVIIEHTMHAMLRLADRFLVLDHGAVLAEGSPQRGGRGPRGDRGVSRLQIPRPPQRDAQHA